MQILTSAEMAAADRRSVEAGVSITELMAAAGAAVARFCLRQYPSTKRVLAVCGKGNNGGDGIVAATMLAAAGLEVRVLLLGRVSELKGDAAGAGQRLKAVGIEVVELVEEAQIAAIFSEVVSNPTSGGGAGLTWRNREIGTGAGVDLILDAVVGTGFKPPLRGLAAAVRDAIATMRVPVVAVDVPSGWDADSMEPQCSGTFRADAVVTFTRPKLAHLFGELTGSRRGPVVVAAIGTPDTAIVAERGLHWAGSAKSVAERPRDANSNKGKFGHVLLIGGSYGTAGAAAMASLAAMRTGAGLVTAAVPKGVLPTVAGIAPELMVRPLDETPGTWFGLPPKADASALARQLPGITVVGLGPGLGQATSTRECVLWFVERATVPLVVDADALNAIAATGTPLLTTAAAGKDASGRGRVLVLTPHPGEMARLLGVTVKEVEADRITLARRFATAHGVTLVLKGWRTLIAHPDGRVAVNTTGNPAMAKGGSGDILTGIVSAMLAQYARSCEPADVAQAVEAAVYLHGLAGDFAAAKMDEHTVLATDTLACLTDAFRYRVRDADGFTWICDRPSSGT